MLGFSLPRTHTRAPRCCHRTTDEKAPLVSSQPLCSLREANPDEASLCRAISVFALLYRLILLSLLGKYRVRDCTLFAPRHVFHFKRGVR